MINAILFIIGFLISAGTFGTHFIAGVDLMQYWLWISAVLATILTVVFVVIGAFGASYAAQEYKFKIPFLAPLGGSILGGVVATLIFAASYVQLWLSYYIIESIPKTANAFNEFPVNTQYAIYAFIAIMLINTIRSIRFKSK